MKTLARTVSHCARCQSCFGLGGRFAQSYPNSECRSRRTRHLTARKFDAVLRVKPFKLSPNTAREQILHSHAENPGQDKQFQIGNAPLLVFQTRHRFPAGIPAEQLQFDGKVILRPSLAQAKFPHLGTDDVQLCRFFLDAGTLAAAPAPSCRLYLTSYAKISCRFCLTLDKKMFKRKAGFMKAIGREIVVSGRRGVALARALTGAGFLFDAGLQTARNQSSSPPAFGRRFKPVESFSKGKPNELTPPTRRKQP